MSGLELFYQRSQRGAYFSSPRSPLPIVILVYLTLPEYLHPLGLTPMAAPSVVVRMAHP